MKSLIHKRDFLKRIGALGAAAAASPFAASSAFAQGPNWPDKAIRLLVPYPPGGSTDPIARILGEKLQAMWGQPWVIENRPGGNTSIASAFIAKAQPDGYNLLFSSISTHVIHTMQAQLPYDSLRDFTPIGTVSRSGYMLAIHPSVPAKTLQEFVAYAKANPGKLNFASVGIGNANHLSGELFNQVMGTKITHVPYKGSGPALVDFIAGRVQMMLTTIAALQPQVDAGQLRALAVTGSQPGKGGVPTFESMGYKEFNPIELVTMILAPKELPLAITNKLADGMSKTLEMPDVRKAIETQNQQPFFIGPKELAERLKNDRAKFADIVEKGHIKLTDA